MARIVSETTRQRLRQAHLSRKQQHFVEEYVHLANGAEAARRAGYKPKAARQMASENLSKPDVKAAVEREIARIALEITPTRVKRRLDTISHNAEAAGQFGPAVRAEELLGKSIGMWVDQSLQLSGQLKDEHIQALMDLAKKRQAEPVDLADDDT